MKRLWVTAAAAATLAVTGCGASYAPPAPGGFFPAVFSAPGFVANAELLNAVAVSGHTQRLRFHAVAPASGGWAFVVRCYRGNVRVGDGGVSFHAVCNGTTGAIAGCAGGINDKVTARVEQTQPSAWGIAVYRSRCQPESAETVRIKERGAPQQH